VPAELPQELEAAFIMERQANSASPTWEERLRRGHSLMPDSDAAEALYGHQDMLKLGDAEVSFLVHPRFMPRRREVIKGIIEEETDLGYVNPVIANITIHRKPFLLRAAERALGDTPNAQYLVTRENPQDDQQVIDIVNTSIDQAIKRLRDIPHVGEAFTARHQAILGQREEALERWDIS